MVPPRPPPFAARSTAPKKVLVLYNVVLTRMIGSGIERIRAHNSSGPPAALPTAFPSVPVQSHQVHKIGSSLDKVHKPTTAPSGIRHRPDPLHTVSPSAGALNTLPPSDVSQTTSGDSSPAGGTSPWPTVKRFESPMPSSSAFAKSGGEPGPWASFRIDRSMERIPFTVCNHETRIQDVSMPLRADKNLSTLLRWIKCSRGR